MYQTEIWDLNDQKQKITDAIVTNDDTMLQRTRPEIENRLDVLRATNGAHIEMY